MEAYSFSKVLFILFGGIGFLWYKMEELYNKTFKD